MPAESRREHKGPGDMGHCSGEMACSEDVFNAHSVTDRQTAKAWGNAVVTWETEINLVQYFNTSLSKLLVIFKCIIQNAW